MATQIAPRPGRADIIEKVLVEGDLSPLTADERVSYYNRVCESLGLNPLTKPFEYVKFQGKVILYARRDATDQLRKLHGVSVRLTERQVIEGVCVVQATATDKTGRVDEATGAVNIAGLRGELLANAIMKAETKAKRRVTLSIVGLGMLDESDIEEAPAPAEPPPPPQAPSQPLGLPSGKALTQPEPNPDMGEAQDPEIAEVPFPADGKANASAWRAYANEIFTHAQRAPNREWLMDFQICNQAGMDALKAASANYGKWLTERMGELARSLPEIAPEDAMAAG